MHPIFFFFFFGIPFVTCKSDYRYSNCSQDFHCGHFRNLGYPFWADSRPSYCGHPKYKLKCLEDGTAEFQMMAQTYRVLCIEKEMVEYKNYYAYYIRIARNDSSDSWNGNCPTQSNKGNIILDPDFTFKERQMLTLFYGCPSLPSRVPNRFKCQINGTISDASFSKDGTGEHPRDPRSYPEVFKPLDPELYPEVLKCNISIVVPLRGKIISLFNLLEWKVEDVARAGFEVQFKTPGCSECEDSGGKCGYDGATSSFTCFCRNGPAGRACLVNGQKKISMRKNISMWKKTSIPAIVSGILVTVGAIVICCCIRTKSYISRILWKRKTKNSNVEDFLERGGLLTPRRYMYKEVKKMTNSFKEKIGQGGYGSVFKGNLPSGHMVAVKVLSETKGNGDEFINEVACISRTSHVNIVSLLGFCVKGLKRALIYEFMPNGSLEKFVYQATPLRKNPHLGWETLYKVVNGIARGLEYLHRGCNTQILHFDIKPHNILLDHDFTPKIADFGMSKLCRVDQSIISMTGARGTPGYIAPELISRNFGGVSHKSDVYSYGMMVLELVGGRKNVNIRADNSSEVYFPDWLYKRLDLNEDLGLHGVTSSEDQEISQKMILVGLWCIQIDPQNRPSMSRVLDMLEGSLEALQIPPKPSLSSPPREEASPSREEEGSSFSVLTL